MIQDKDICDGITSECLEVVRPCTVWPLTSLNAYLLPIDSGNKSWPAARRAAAYSNTLMFFIKL